MTVSALAAADHLVLTGAQCRGCRGSSFDVERGRYGVLLRCRSCELTATIRVRCRGAHRLGRGVVRAGEVVCSDCGVALPLPAPSGA